MIKSRRRSHKKKRARLKNKRNCLVLENKSKLLVLENKSKLLVLESKSRYQLLKNYNKVVSHLNRIQISLQEQQEAQNFSNQSRTLDQSLQLG